VSKADYPYPDDEFDAPPDPTSPRGVHRAPRSAWSRWWPFLVIPVIAVAVAYGAVTYVSRGNDAPAAPGANEDTTTSAAPTKSTTGKPTDSESDEASAEPTETEDAPEANLSAPVVVYNAAGIQGLAATAAGKVEAAGFTNVTADNFGGTAPATSTVFYATDADKATADLVASSLGLTTVVLDAAQAADGISVVLTQALPS